MVLFWFFFGLLAGIFLFSFCVPFRLTVLHPVLTVRYAVTDIYNYFRYKKWRNLKTGKFVCFDAGAGMVFGSGKTLSVVHKIRREYRRYNDRLIFDFSRLAWVRQKVYVVTNLSLKTIPFERLVNLGQIVQVAERKRIEDTEKGTKTCIIVVIDETQNQLHCRSFKDNLSPEMLKSLTECRHFSMSIYYDSPRFSQVDALLRQCTSLNVKCRKIWRWQCHKVYDAMDVENSSNVQNLRPMKRDGFFIDDDLFKEYDTFEIVENLVKAKSRGDYLSDEEILALQCNSPTDIDAVRSKSRALKRDRKKLSS